MTSCRWVFLCLFLLIVPVTCSLALGQGARVTPPVGLPTGLDRDNPQAREQWFMRGRTAPPGSSAAELRYRAHQRKLMLRAMRVQRLSAQVLAAPAASGGGWVPLGPAPLASDATGQGLQDYGPVSGRATAVVVDPADNTGNTVYVGGAYGGVWRSQNAASGSYGNPTGVIWTSLTDNQPTLAIGAIALQPGNVIGNLSKTILVGTGEANYSGDSYYGLGFLRSTDAGNSWSLITSADNGTRPFRGLAVSKIVFGSTTGLTNTVVAGVGFSGPGEMEGGDNLVSTPHGIYYSQDGGASWHLATVQDSGVTISPESPTDIVFNAANQTFYAAIRRHGFYSSPDGINWTRLATQPGGGVLAATTCVPNPTQSSFVCPMVRGALAVVPGRNEMYAWIADFDATLNNPDVDRGIWQSADGGNSWTPISTSGIDNCGDFFGCGADQGWYNLELAATPNGQVTDLYAGAVNLFKCTISSINPVCSATPFLNLTHVYGCSPLAAPAHVHPDQHGIDFMVVNNGTQDIMYFTNDGGIYRALDGYTGLTTGSCTGANQFDSLNGTIGSLTQFVAISQHPTDANTILGGTQDNGSPATATATTSLAWENVNNGDGGFNAINPISPADWFTSHPDDGGGTLAIEHCALGINCHVQDFANGEVVTSNDLQGDDGAFYFPYILDPQAPNEMLVGTCRVWRGPALGGWFTALSNNFETGTSAATCTGSEVNTVTSIAAGGPKDTNGFSQAVYATTSGLGALTSVSSLPAGGHVFVTTNASTTLMSDVTGSINPSNYPISSVAIDSSDASGQTAYVTIMGFGVSHAFKTTNAGGSWADFTGTGLGALPDAPANAVVVDSSAGVVFVGTDAGVFSSATSAPNWTEVPAANLTTGFLPNTTVVGLALFDSGGQKLLRAATHGRGVWQISAVPYYISISNSPQTILANQQATFNGTVSSFNGYNNSVALSCTAGTTAPPATCTLTPSSVTPTANFTITAGGPTGDYNFNAHGVGSDLKSTTQDQGVTLHIVDFGLTTPNPSSVTANRPSSSNPTSFQVTAAGSFNQAVTLSCGGLPTGGACDFSPSGVVSPTSSSPVAVTLIINTSPSTPAGTYPLTISGTTTNPTGIRTRNLTLVVTAIPDYILAITNSPQSALVDQTATFNGILTAVNGYSSPVNLGCGTGAPPTCTLTPASVTPTASGAPVSATVSSTQAQSYSFNIVGTGTDASHVSHSAAVVFNSLSDFSIVDTTGSQAIKAGQQASYILNVAPLGSGSFQNAVALACSGLPAGASCSFNPPQIASGSGATNVTMTISTLGPNLAAPLKMVSHFALWIAVLGLSVSAVAWSSGKTRRSAVLCIVTLLIVSTITLEACGGGSSGGGNPPPPTNPITVTIIPSTPISLAVGDVAYFTATVSGASNKQVSWEVNGIAGGSSTFGTIDSTGGNVTYHAPTSLPNPATFNVTATSQADTSKSASDSVTILAQLTINPTSVTVFTSGTQQFSSNQSVNWQVNGIAGGNSTFGTIDSTGLYTAPTSVPNPATFNVTAVSQVDRTKSASASVTVQPATPPGTYTVTVTATEGTLVHTTTAILVVQ